MTTISKKVLHIDIETYCDLDLAKTGVYAYASHPSFEILLLAYAYGNDPVQCIDLTLDEVPLSLINDLQDPNIIKAAHNANFEMTCLSEYFLLTIDPQQWVCTMALAMHHGLPGSLNNLGSVLNLEEQKMSVGSALISYFCKPCKPTKANGQRIRNLSHHDKEKWLVFKEYCIRDVEVEQKVYNLLSHFDQPTFERDVYILDQTINSRGILIDYEFVNQAVAIDREITERYLNEMRDLTGMDNPNSTAQFKKWLNQQGIVVSSFTKKNAKELLDSVTNDTVKRAIQLKLLLSKTSTAKYEAMQRADNGDHRIRGLFQYYGANRTGRWAGRLVQLQNLPQNHIRELDMARTLVKEGDIETLELLYNSVPDILSQLIRTAFVAKENHKFIVADYSAIEARVIAWLAGEKWRTEVFATHGKIYEASASQMFKVPIEEITKGSPLRQKGKVAELALGYGGGPSALKAMGALEMGIVEEELTGLVKVWRTSNKMITKLWNDVGTCAIEAIDNKSRRKLKNLSFEYIHGHLYITLPSKRILSYRDAAVVEGAKGPRITYKGINQTSRKWETTDTWGGKLVENIVQAIARDCLAYAMLELNRRGYEIVGHVHDEVIIETTMDKKVADVCNIMGLSLPWCADLYLKAEGYETLYYKKD